MPTLTPGPSPKGEGRETTELSQGRGREKASLLPPGEGLGMRGCGHFRIHGQCPVKSNESSRWWRMARR